MPFPMLLILAQATPVVAAPSPPQRIILAGQCPVPAPGEAIVCGLAEAPRLPLPDERGPSDHPVPGNPDVSGVGALAMANTPCAASQWGCQVGVDLFGMATAAARLIGKAINPNSCCDEPGQSTNPGMLLRDAAGVFRKKADKSQRVAIDLSAPPPSLARRLLP